MEKLANFNLKPYNTMSVNAKAKTWIKIESIEDLDKICPLENENILILGEGSNMLFTQDFDGTILCNRIKGRSIEKEDNEFIYVRFGAGENWHETVLWCVENNYGGLENLSLIPGTVGAAPVQNIGAYGIEVGEVIEYVEAFHLQNKSIKKFSASECNFAYRESVFKNILKGEYCIVSVCFKLKKNPTVFNLAYKDVAETLQEMGISQSPTLRNISDAIIAIRTRKLYAPSEMPNTGSFFKNPILPLAQIEKLQALYPTIPTYNIAQNPLSKKISAAWLIEQAGWKGKALGKAAVSQKHALVLTNPNGLANGAEIWALAMAIQKDVFEQFGVKIEAEVQII